MYHFERRMVMDVIKELMNSEFYIKPIPEDATVAMAYVPFQNARQLYPTDKALCVGTLFPELNKPFDPDKAMGGKRNE